MSKYEIDVGSRMKEYRTKAGISQKEMAERLDIKQARYSNWEQGLARPDADYIVAFCKVLNVSVDEFLGTYKNFSLSINEAKLMKLYRQLDIDGREIVMTLTENLIAYRKRLIDEDSQSTDLITRPTYLLPAAAGTGQFLDSEDYENVDYPSDVVPLDSQFAIKVSGDSMEPDYYDGDVVFIKRQIDLEPGEIGVFILNNGGYIKELKQDGYTTYLHSHNPKYEDIQIHEYDDLRVVGKVIGKFRKK